MTTVTRLRAPLSTSNLVQPGRDALLRYAHEAHRGLPIVATLEHRLAAFHETAYCIALCNGFWGLVFAIRALARPGATDLLMPSLTYRRMADVAAWARLRPRFCEVDPATLAVTAATMAAALTPTVALLLPVHPIIGCCDVAGIAALGRDHGLPVLFDSVESAFEHVPEGRIGRFGNAECFSLHASKLLNGCEGGYLTTNDPALAARLAALRDGTAPDGMDMRLDPLHAAMALAALDDLDDQVLRNRIRYDAYRTRLAGLPGLRLVPFADTSPTSFKNILVELTDAWPLSRDDTIQRLNARDVLARAYYHPPLHAKPMAYPHVPATLPMTDRLSQRYLLLPCGHHVDADGIARVVRLLAGMAA